MPTLYVENIPEDLYEALRERAKSNHRSLAKEVIALLSSELPTKAELKRRKDLLGRLDRLRGSASRPAGNFPDSVELIREGRDLRQGSEPPEGSER